MTIPATITTCRSRSSPVIQPKRRRAASAADQVIWTFWTIIASAQTDTPATRIVGYPAISVNAIAANAAAVDSTSRNPTMSRMTGRACVVLSADSSRTAMLHSPASVRPPNSATMVVAVT